MPAPRLVAPRPSLPTRLGALPRQARTAVRLYQRTPPLLRDPDRAVRIGVSSAALWFAALFASLVPVTGDAAPGFALAGLGGLAAAALAATRRLRPAVALLVAMLVTAQVAAVGPMLAAALVERP